MNECINTLTHKKSRLLKVLKAYEWYINESEIFDTFNIKVLNHIEHEVLIL